MNENFTAGFFKDFDDFGTRLKQRFTQQLDKTDDLKDANEKLALKVRLYKEKNQNLETEIKQRDEKLKQIESRLAEKTSQCEKLEKEKETWDVWEVKDEELKKLNFRLLETISQCAKFQESNQNLISKVQTSDKKAKKTDEKIKQTTAHLMEKVTECDNLAASNRKLKAEIQSYKSQNFNIQKRNIALIDENGSLKEEISQLLTKQSKHPAEQKDCSEQKSQKGETASVKRSNVTDISNIPTKYIKTESDTKWVSIENRHQVYIQKLHQIVVGKLCSGKRLFCFYSG